MYKSPVCFPLMKINGLEPIQSISALLGRTTCSQTLYNDNIPHPSNTGLEQPVLNCYRSEQSSGNGKAVQI